MVWPVPPVHAQLLPTGEVLFFPESNDPYVWDPVSQGVAPLPKAPHNIFCSGLALLADGKVLLTGGHADFDFVGLASASTFDPFSEVWARLPDMNAGRWYPTNTPLPNGDVLVTSGSLNPIIQSNPVPQIWQPGNGSWRDLLGAFQFLPLYPRMFVAPTGRVFYAGPGRNSQLLSLEGAGSWSFVAESRHDRDYGTAVLYGDGKVLIVGGGLSPTSTAETIDLNALAPSWKQVASMSVPRRQLNATLLPDGTVLVTGGSSGVGFDDRSHPARAAELWDPKTNTWTVLASAQIYRGYHSIAMLLPDGRVLTGGGDEEFTAEVFSPPYLFRGARPTVSSAPSFVQYGQTFVVYTPDAPWIEKVMLIRLSAVTHAFDMGQRGKSLRFTKAIGGISVSMTASRELVPPGYYLLFLVNGAGVPSVGQIVQVGGAPPPPARLVAFGDLWRFDDAGVDRGAGWVSPGYDDSGWKSGPAQLGFGDGDEATVLAKGWWGSPSYLFRKKVTLNGPIVAAELSVRFDDGVAVWINGNLVLSKNTAFGTAFGTYASAVSTDNELVKATVPAGPFVVGENTVAVMVKNAQPFSSDLSFDLQLDVTRD